MASWAASWASCIMTRCLKDSLPIQKRHVMNQSMARTLAASSWPETSDVKESPDKLPIFVLFLEFSIR